MAWRPGVVSPLRTGLHTMHEGQGALAFQAMRFCHSAIAAERLCSRSAAHYARLASRASVSHADLITPISPKPKVEKIVARRSRTAHSRAPVRGWRGASAGRHPSSRAGCGSRTTHIMSNTAARSRRPPGSPGFPCEKEKRIAPAREFSADGNNLMRSSFAGGNERGNRRLRTAPAAGRFAAGEIENEGMDNDRALALMNQLLWNVTMIAGPLLLAALITGLIISVLQVATQLQEMTLSYVPKLIVSALVLVLLGPWMLHRVTQFAIDMIKLLPQLG